MVAARIAGVEQWGDLFSLCQLLVDALLLPVAIVTFIMAANEFKKAQRSPELDVCWEVEPGKIEKRIQLSVPLPTGTLSKPVEHDRAVRPVLVNRGKAVAVWYMLSFDVPLEILNVQRRPPTDIWHRHAGDISNWRQDILADVWRVVFLSNGEIACYPGNPLPLGILNLGIATDSQAKGYAVPFRIVTDRGDIAEGWLLVRLDWVSAE